MIRVYKPKSSLFGTVMVMVIALACGLFIYFLNDLYSPILSTDSMIKMRELNNKYGFELGEDLLSAPKSSAITSLLKNDVLNMEGVGKNKGIIVKFKNQYEDGHLILITPKNPIHEEKLMEIASEYAEAIPEIDFAEADIVLEIYSNGQPETAKMGLFSKLMQSAIQNAGKFNDSDELLQKTTLSSTQEKWWLRKRDKNHNLRARLNFSTLSGRAPVAVLDSGGDISHPYLTSNIWLNTNEKPGNNLDDDNNEYVDDLHGCDFTRTKCNDVADEIGHGTHVMGIIVKYTVSNDPGKVAILKVFDKKSESRLSYAIRAIKYASDNGMRVLNISFGTTIDSMALKDATEYAYSKGAFIVAAAGNNASSKPHYPAAYEKVISVGAYNKEGGRLEESNYGDWVDLSAPGERILSTIPDGRYGYLNGTSQAAPFVSAAVSNILLENPNIGISAMKEELKKINFLPMNGPSPYDLE